MIYIALTHIKNMFKVRHITMLDTDSSISFFQIIVSIVFEVCDKMSMSQ
jgi:hypothetical protein